MLAYCPDRNDSAIACTPDQCRSAAVSGEKAVLEDLKIGNMFWGDSELELLQRADALWTEGGLAKDLWLSDVRYVWGSVWLASQLVALPGTTAERRLHRTGALYHVLDDRGEGAIVTDRLVNVLRQLTTDHPSAEVISLFANRYARELRETAPPESVERIRMCLYEALAIATRTYRFRREDIPPLGTVRVWLGSRPLTPRQQILRTLLEDEKLFKGPTDLHLRTALSQLPQVDVIGTMFETKDEAYGLDSSVDYHTAWSPCREPHFRRRIKEELERGLRESVTRSEEEIQKTRGAPRVPAGRVPADRRRPRAAAA